MNLRGRVIEPIEAGTTRARRERTIGSPGLSLSFLLMECRALLGAPEGAPVSFSDGSRARLRYEEDAERAWLVLSRLEVAEDWACGLVVLQGEGSLVLVEPGAPGAPIRVGVAKGQIESSAGAWLLRLVKIPSGVLARAWFPLCLQFGHRSDSPLAGMIRFGARSFPVCFAPATDPGGESTGWYAARFPAELEDEILEVRGSGTPAVLLERNLWIEAPRGAWGPDHPLVLCARGIGAPTWADAARTR